MSLEQITAVVENFISDTHNELLVIKGKWGAGKTFFWQNLIEESKHKRCIGRDFYSYVSLFGVNSLEELNNAILVSAVESNATKSKRKLDPLIANIRKLATSLEKSPALREYTGGMVSAFLHFLLDNTLICFDDIERRGDGLTIKDVFGLASLFKEQRNCKVLLIMNDERLGVEAQEQFKLHGEKLIDREIRFSITAEESFGYIFQSSFRCYDFIKDCCFTLHIKNIRTLQRIKRFIEDITPHLKDIENQVVEEVFSSLILYVWSYYDKSGDVPSLKFVSDSSTASIYLSEKNKEEMSAEVKEWNKILSIYGYLYTDDVGKCLIEFVETGYIDKPKFSAELNKKNEQHLVQKGIASYSEVWGVYCNSFDDNEQEFIEKLVDNFRSNIKIMSLSNLQSAVDVLREFESDHLADALVDEYFSHRNAEEDIIALKQLKHSAFSDELKDEYLLSRLRNIWTSKETDKRSLADVLKSITFKEGWHWEDVRYMDSFSVDDYYNFFKTEQSKELYLYVRKCLDFEEIKHDSEMYKSVAEKAKKALLKLATESRINRMRVSRLYKINVT